MGRDPVKTLQERLGVPVRDSESLRVALTHRSWVNEHRDAGIGDNERLEFLGDAALDLVVSQRLMERLPHAPEGTLSRLRATLVDEGSLSEVAKTLDLGALLYLGRGEEASGGREKASLLANALEAVLGALYEEGGLEAVTPVVDRLFSVPLERAAAGQPDEDYKTALQELAQRRGIGLPRYSIVDSKGPAHQRTFVARVEVGDVGFEAEGRTKKVAEQLGAKLALAALEGGSAPKV